jgi:hypothetical protein
MKENADTYLLLWGGPVVPASAGRVLYWAANHKGNLCGIIMPADSWNQAVASLKKADAKAPYLSLAVSSLHSRNPDLKSITINPDVLVDFCHLKNTVYRFRQTPVNLKLDPKTISARVGMAETASLATFSREHPKQKGEFFTLLPDKTRLELYYLVGLDEPPPLELDVVVMWGIKGFSLPLINPGSDYKPLEHEKLILEKTAVKPQPLWLRRLLGIGKRRSRRAN